MKVYVTYNCSFTSQIGTFVKLYNTHNHETLLFKVVIGYCRIISCV